MPAADWTSTSRSVGSGGQLFANLVDVNEVMGLQDGVTGVEVDLQHAGEPKGTWPTMLRIAVPSGCTRIWSMPTSLTRIWLSPAVNTTWRFSVVRSCRRPIRRER